MKAYKIYTPHFDGEAIYIGDLASAEVSEAPTIERAYLEAGISLAKPNLLVLIKDGNGDLVTILYRDEVSDGAIEFTSSQELKDYLDENNEELFLAFNEKASAV